MIRSLCCIAAAVAGCSSPDEACDPSVDACVLERVFPDIDMPAGAETDDLCVSWTLNNPTDVWLHRVDSENAGLVHHSNWFHVPDFRYDVPDGVWTCSDHDWDELANAILGGVVHAQSTQAQSEVQQFGDGAAVRIPPYSRVVGNLHLLNATDADASTHMTLRLSTIPPADVTTALVPFELMYRDLSLPARGTSAFRIDCDVDAAYRAQTGHGFEATIHFVLPHYHALGDMFELGVIGGDRDGDVVYGSEGDTYGEALGRSFDPPIELGQSGARGLSFVCGFDNPRPAEVGWGIGDQEMCLVFGFMESDARFRGTVEKTDLVSDGPRPEHTGECNLIIQAL